MAGPERQLQIGDRVRAKQRKDFPDGVIVQILDDHFALVRWDGHLLETAHTSDLELVEKT